MAFGLSSTIYLLGKITSLLWVLFQHSKLGLVMSISHGYSKPQIRQAGGPGSKHMNLNRKQVCVQLFSPLLWTLDLAKCISLGCWRTKVTKRTSNTCHGLGTQYGSHRHDVKAPWRPTGALQGSPLDNRVLWLLGWLLLLASSSYPSSPPWSRMQIVWCPRAPDSRENYSSDTPAPLAEFRRQLHIYGPHRRGASPSGRETHLGSGDRFKSWISPFQVVWAFDFIL